MGTVAKDLGLIDQTLRNWVKAAEAGKLRGAGKKVVTAEQMELSRLRAENIRLRRENEILKKATLSSTGQRNTICSNLDLEDGVWHKLGDRVYLLVRRRNCGVDGRAANL